VGNLFRPFSMMQIKHLTDSLLTVVHKFDKLSVSVMWDDKYRTYTGSHNSRSTVFNYPFPNKISHNIQYRDIPSIKYEAMAKFYI